jgi:hypothetical protein
MPCRPAPFAARLEAQKLSVSPRPIGSSPSSSARARDHLGHLGHLGQQGLLNLEVILQTVLQRDRGRLGQLHDDAALIHGGQEGLARHRIGHARQHQSPPARPKTSPCAQRPPRAARHSAAPAAHQPWFMMMPTGIDAHLEP